MAVSLVETGEVACVHQLRELILSSTPFSGNPPCWRGYRLAMTLASSAVQRPSAWVFVGCPLHPCSALRYRHVNGPYLRPERCKGQDVLSSVDMADWLPSSEENNSIAPEIASLFRVRGFVHLLDH